MLDRTNQLEEQAMCKKNAYFSKACQQKEDVDQVMAYVYTREDVKMLNYGPFLSCDTHRKYQKKIFYTCFQMGVFIS